MFLAIPVNVVFLSLGRNWISLCRGEQTHRDIGLSDSIVRSKTGG